MDRRSRRVYCRRTQSTYPHPYLVPAPSRHLLPQPAVTKRIPQPRAELEPSVRAQEAKLLATMLRTTRLTWVFGEPGTDKSALLRSGVMPLLQRRRDDRGLTGALAGTAARAPGGERRRQVSRPRRELAIYFDAWDDAPLQRLKRRILAIAPADTATDDSLAALLQRMDEQQRLHFVFVLDRFEDYLARSPHDAEASRFADELVEAIERESAPASFLVALDEAARPALERFRSRLPGFDHDVLRLSPVAPAVDRPDPRDVPTLVDVHEPVPAAPRPRQRAPIKVEDVYAFIEATLIRTSSNSEPALSVEPKPEAPARQ